MIDSFDTKLLKINERIRSITGKPKVFVFESVNIDTNIIIDIVNEIIGNNNVIPNIKYFHNGNILYSLNPPFKDMVFILSFVMNG